MSFSIRHIFFILATIIIAIGIVVVLAWNIASPNYEKNGFSRNFVVKALGQLSMAKKNQEVTDICGATPYHLYFKTKTPGRILITNHDLQTTQYSTLNVTNDKKTASLFYCFVDSPWVSILAGNVPAAIISQFDKTATTYKFPAGSFTRAVMLAPYSYVLRSFDSTLKMADQIFIKGNPASGYLERKKNIIATKHDAGLATDGLLNYDKMTHLITYVFFYQNQFLCLDTNLNVVYNRNTIDTTNTNRTQTGNFFSARKTNTFTTTGPARFINGRSCVDNKKLYINSKLKADNETDENFMHNSVIDVYNIKNGQYESSFYIPSYKGENMINFKIINRIIIVLYKTYMISYRLPFE